MPVLFVDVPFVNFWCFPILPDADRDPGTFASTKRLLPLRAERSVRFPNSKDGLRARSIP